MKFCYKSIILLLALTFMLAGCAPQGTAVDVPLDIAAATPMPTATPSPTPLPTPEPAPTPEPGPADRAQELRDSFFTQLINADNRLAEDYVPEGLIPVRENNPTGTKLKKRDMLANAEALDAFNAMILAAEADGVEGFYLVSVYRDFAEQQSLFDKKVAADPSYGTDPEVPLITAYAGASEHQTGLAFDITAENARAMSARFANTPQGEWLYAHCHEYGFILRYPKGKEHITKIVFEPWHFRYVGRELADYLVLCEFVLEELYYGIALDPP